MIADCVYWMENCKLRKMITKPFEPNINSIHHYVCQLSSIHPLIPSSDKCESDDRLFTAIQNQKQWKLWWKRSMELSSKLPTIKKPFISANIVCKVKLFNIKNHSVHGDSKWYRIGGHKIRKTINSWFSIM